ncbi:hypothetical protein BV898_00593 [Hypsibius exemplaris]|nr:hypothetical protein BV898_00593 [Hypsibius exemplaris]
MFKLPTFIRVTTYTGCVILFLATLFNILILVTFLRRPRRLIKPFTIHVVNNSCLEILTGALFCPMFLYRNFDREIYRQNGYCAAYKYLNWTMPAMLLLQHGIIITDRWLAILKPMWYREKKTVGFGVKSTIGVFVYLQVWFLPLFVADTISPKIPGQYCDDTAAWPRYQLVVRLMSSVVPVVLMDFSYPFLVFMVWKRKTAQIHTGAASGRGGRTARSATHHMGLALWLLMVQILLWTPVNVTSMLIGMRSRLTYLYDVHTFAVVLSGVLLMVDPIIYLAFLKDLRKEVFLELHEMLRCGRTRRDQVLAHSAGKSWNTSNQRATAGQSTSGELGGLTAGHIKLHEVI